MGSEDRACPSKDKAQWKGDVLAVTEMTLTLSSAGEGGQG